MPTYINTNTPTTLSSASSITITQSCHYVSGSTTINTINGGEGGVADLLVLIPTSGSTWKFGTGGNVKAVANPATFDRPIFLVWDDSVWREVFDVNPSVLNAIQFAEPVTSSAGAVTTSIGNAVTALGGNEGLVVIPSTMAGGPMPTLPSGTNILDLRGGGNGGLAITRQNSSSGYLGLSVFSKNGIGGALAGTVSITTGSTTVTGSGTNFTGDFAVGDPIFIDGQAGHVIKSITNNTQLDVASAYLATASGKSYTDRLRNAIAVFADAREAGDGTNVIGVQGTVASVASAGVFGYNVGSYVLGTGTVSTTASNSTVTGSGTAFSNQLAVGGTVRINNAEFTVATLASATSMTVSPAPAFTISGAAFEFAAGGPGVQGDASPIPGSIGVLGVASEGSLNQPGIGVLARSIAWNSHAARFEFNSPTNVLGSYINIGAPVTQIPIDIAAPCNTATIRMTDSTYGPRIQMLANTVDFEVKNTGGDIRIGTTSNHGVTLRVNSSDRISMNTGGYNAFAGGAAVSTRVVTASSVSASLNDQVIVTNPSSPGAVTVTLAGSPPTGLTITVKDGKGDAATNNVTVSPSAGNIDGAGTSVINSNYGAKTFVYNGTQWNVI